MRNLVRRYVTVEQRKAESQGVTEDDVNEIKQDISGFRCELVEILKNSGMDTGSASGQGSGIFKNFNIISYEYGKSRFAGSGGKKNRQKERRLMKGFEDKLPPVSELNVPLLLNPISGSHDDFRSITGPGITPRKSINPMHQQYSSSQSQSSFGDSHGMGRFSRFAPKFHSKRPGSHKKRWGNLKKLGK